MDLPFKRVYVDIPASTHAKLVELARQRGMPQKRLIAELIERECESEPEPQAPKRGKRK